MKEDIAKTIYQLKNGSIGTENIPDDYISDPSIIKAERDLNLRRIYQCGYDIIQDRFFVEEEVYQNNTKSWESLEPKTFETFPPYYAFLDGNIYENACYYLLDSQKITTDVDQSKLYQSNSFINYTIDDFSISPTKSEKDQYQQIEKRKSFIKKWIIKFDECRSCDQLRKVISNYRKCSLYESVNISFFFWNYIYADTHDPTRFQVIMDYVSSNDIFVKYMIRALCLIYDPDEVLDGYYYYSGSYQTYRKHIRDIQKICEKVKHGDYSYHSKGYLDDDTHFYCVETEVYEKGKNWPAFSCYRYFETITDFVRYRKEDLRDCDLSELMNVTYDFSHCLTDSTTKLPVCNNTIYDYSVKKYSTDFGFHVLQLWNDKSERTIKKRHHIFHYFCDFVAFLKRDLSNADLISCDGLLHLPPNNGICFQNVLATSPVCKKLGIPYDQYVIDAPSQSTFEITRNNETESVSTVCITQDPRKTIITNDLSDDYYEYNMRTARIYYISDIHLYHLLMNKKVQSMIDIKKIISDLADTISEECDSNRIVLINGDTSLDLSCFKLFVSELAKHNLTAVFTIGNHDIWSCPNDTFDQIVEKYRSITNENGAYLLQNDVLFFNEYNQPPERITADELKNTTKKVLRNRTRAARLILFGGTGFSGYNSSFNAKSGLYRYNKTIEYSRDFEKSESRRIESLYKRVCSVFPDKKVVVMTHMPLSDWFRPSSQGKPSGNANGPFTIYHPRFIYVSGHTHRNHFYDDGEIRIYADNQFGYNESNPSAWPHLKFFEIDNTFDYFSDYKDGIYVISPNDYKQFYNGKNIYMEFNRAVNILYMLKKNGFYCFIHKSKQNRLSILNGGNLKHLENKDINYYYANMDLAISKLKNPLEKYTSYQQKIADEIIKLGGYGTIHGCIVDIDYFSHIFVNPIDGTITGYWASDIINKIVYPSIPALLEAQCPNLYTAYTKALNGKQSSNVSNPFIQESTLALQPIIYLDTDIYSVSRQIKKMQKLHSNILTIWPEKLPKQKKLDGKLPKSISEKGSKS